MIVQQLILIKIVYEQTLRKSFCDFLCIETDILNNYYSNFYFAKKEDFYPSCHKLKIYKSFTSISLWDYFFNTITKIAYEINSDEI